MPELKKFSHDHMITVLQDKYPALRFGRDYLVVHAINPETDEQDGDPWILWWKAKEVAQPTDAEIRAAFYADEARYRSIYLRVRRDYELEDSDGKATVPPDAPPGSKAAQHAEAWRVYRQALRDVPQQPGFPFDVVWPQWPGS
jgi:hypothetical protein